MKDINELMRLKEQQIDQLQKEVELLRAAANIMAESESGPTVVRSAANGGVAAPAPVTSVAAKRWP